MNKKIKSAVLAWSLAFLSISICIVFLEIFLERYPQFIPEPVKMEIIKKKLVNYWMRNVYAKWYSNWMDDKVLGLKRPPNYHYIVEPEFYGEQVWFCFTDPVKESCGGVDITYDKDGFRNTKSYKTAKVVALGDSLTEGLYLQKSWSEMLGSLLNTDVYNLGTGHFGPVQERIAFKKYGQEKNPSLVILAFYEGNDLDDNEMFDKVQKSGLPWHIYDKQKFTNKIEAEKFEIKKTIIWTFLEYGYEHLFHSDRVKRRKSSQGEKNWFNYQTPQGERGFAISSKINAVIKPRGEIEKMKGWEMTRESLVGLKSDCKQRGTRILVVFVPTQEHVLLPLVLRTLGDDYFNRQVSLLFKDGQQINYSALLKENADNQRDMLQNFCEEEGIPFLDLTTLLRDEAENGYPVYYPRDSHFNTHGAETTAQAIFRYSQKIKWSH